MNEARQIYQILNLKAICPKTKIPLYFKQPFSGKSHIKCFPEGTKVKEIEEKVKGMLENLCLNCTVL